MARMEIVARRERRRNWSDEEKLRLLNEAEARGLSFAEFARRNDLYPQQLYTWRREFRALWAAKREPIDNVTFLPVELHASTSTTVAQCADTKSAGDMIEVSLSNGRVLRAPIDIAADRLGALVRVLEEA